MNNGCLKPYPWMGRMDDFEYANPPPSAEEKWKRTQVILRKLEHDWKHRTRRLRVRGRKRRMNRGKLGMRLLILTER